MTKNEKPKTDTLDMMPVQEPAMSPEMAIKSRFAPSQIANVVYKGTRIRQFESYQAITAREVLKECGIASLEDFDSAESKPRAVKACAAFLQICLVCAESGEAVAQLFRKGDLGLENIRQELKPREIVEAMKVAAIHGDFY